MHKRLNGKVAIITGGSRGLGRAVCLAFAREGADVVINDIDSEAVLALASDIENMGNGVLVITGDVRDKQKMEAMVEAAIDKFNKIDIVVNSAGVIRDMAMYKMAENDWNDVMDVCLKGTFIVTQAVTGWMVPQARKEREEGKQSPARKIINITSGAVRGNPGQANYCAAKAGIIGLTRSNAKEFGRHNILVNAVSPVALTEMTQDMKETLARATVLGRIGDPEIDIAPVFCFLASDEANYITGQIIGVNGGLDTQY